LLNNFARARCIVAANPANYVDQNTFTPCTQGDAGCIVNPSAYATVGVQRSPQGALQVVDFQSINAGEIETSGVDVGLRYLLDTDWGNWTFALDWTHVIEYEPKDIPGLETGLSDGSFVFDAAGTTGDGSVVRSLPDDRANFMIGFLRGDHAFTTFVRYIDGYRNLGAEAFNSGANPPKTVYSEEISEAYNIDFQYNYSWNWSNDRDPLNLTLGMVNAFDSKPPRRDDYAQGYDSTVHDPRGRRFYLRLVQSF
jgi:hypothetical protein